MKNLTFGEKIRHIRKTKGWSQIKLAEIAGVHAITIVKTENGQTKPILSVQKALCEALGMDLKELQNEADQV